MTDGDFLYRPRPGAAPVVLLSGFATDRRILEGIAPAASRIVPGNGSADGAADRLAAFLRDAGIGKVTLFGWSMGAFVAAEFAEKHPASVERMVLAGARRRFDRPGLDAFRRSLRENPARCLEEFYARCFLPAQRAAYRRFRETLLPSYLREMEVGRLLRDLDYLENAEIRPEKVPPRPAAFVHGGHDVIAPTDEARALAAEIPGAAFHALPNAAHAAFLDPAFPPLAGGVFGERDGG